jgi:hypothetical protein
MFWVWFSHAVYDCYHIIFILNKDTQKNLHSKVVKQKTHNKVGLVLGFKMYYFYSKLI